MAINPFFGPARFGTELIYTVIVVFLCFAIYLKTRESYALTKYKGIKYFRDAFLFFGLSYAVRLIFGIVSFSGMAFDLWLPRPGLFPLLLLSVGYLSTIGIFYLVFSSVWKKLNNKYLLIFSHFIALLLSVIAFITRSHETLFYLQSLLLAATAVFSFITHRKGEKISQVKIFYILILLFWLINLWTIVPRRLFPLEIKMLFQLISLAVFFIIYYKVSKWAK